MIEKIFDRSTRHRFDAASQIYKKGDVCSHIALILDGEIRVYKLSPGGREITLYEIGAGDTCILNASCILSANDYPANAETLSDCDVLLIPGGLFQELISEYEVATPHAEITAKSLSGGNLQRLILARVLSRKPRLVIANLPTQGLDVGAIEFVQNKLMQAKKDNAAILLISGELDEVMSLSDWVAPMYEGKFMGIIPGERAKREDIGAMMAGMTLEALEQ